MGVDSDVGVALATASGVADGTGFTVGNWLGDALRAAATYSSPPRSLPAPPPVAWVGGGSCVADVVTGLLA